MLFCRWMYVDRDNQTQVRFGHMTISQNIHINTTHHKFCLKNTCFLFQDNYYEQVHGAAIGSPISPIVANVFTQE